jgi:predicted phage terminase large subunit-like protein
VIPVLLLVLALMVSVSFVYGGRIWRMDTSCLTRAIAQADIVEPRAFVEAVDAVDSIPPEYRAWLLRNYICGEPEVQGRLSEAANYIFVCENPLGALYRFLFPDYDVVPVIEYMLDFLWAHPQKSFQLAPRSWGKSDIRTVTEGVYEILRNPNIRAAVASKTDHKARELASGVKKKLESPRTAAIFGKQQGKTWGVEGFTVAGRTSEDREPTVTPIGMNCQIAAAHYDVLFTDDIADDNNSKTQVQRDNLHDKFWKELYPTLVSGGKHHSSGTRQHPSDIYSEFLKGEFADCYSRIPAINRSGQSNWPELHPLNTTVVNGKELTGLLKKRERMGIVAFESQFQNSIELMEGKVIKSSWIDDYYYDCEPRDIEDFFKGKRLFISADLAIGQLAHHDEFACGVIGVDDTGSIFVGPCVHDHYTFREQTQRIVNTWERWRRVSTVIRVAIEKNQYQAAQVQAVNECSMIGAIGIHTVKDKESRLQAISGLFEAGKIHLWRGHHADLVEQLLAFPSSTTKDDLVDFLMLAVETARNYGQPVYGIQIHG